MRHTLRNILIVLAAIFFVRCISTYDPPLIGDHESLLVVEGFITDGETAIKLTRSVALSENFYMSDYISGAQVWIESEDGQRFQATEVSPSNYSIAVGTLDEATRYRLRISCDGEEYESNYRFPQPTPPLEEFDFHREGQQMQVRLNVQGEPGGPRHYFWNYEEIWEVHAPLMQSHYLSYFEDDFSSSGVGYTFGDYISNPDAFSFFEYPDVSPVYYCWKYNNSQGLLLGNTELLTDNTVKNHVLYTFSADDDRLSYLYYTKVSQYALGADAYYYYDNQRKNIEETGSIFAPIPSEMQGNIVCTTSPETPVIGFVEVSKLVQREVFRQTYGDTPPTTYCLPLTSEQIAERVVNTGDLERVNTFYLFRWDLPERDTLYATIECIDCRRGGGSKSRPDWWPNDHK